MKKLKVRLRAPFLAINYSHNHRGNNFIIVLFKKLKFYFTTINRNFNNI